jgi:hypothetical protein
MLGLGEGQEVVLTGTLTAPGTGPGRAGEVEVDGITMWEQPATGLLKARLVQWFMN